MVVEPPLYARRCHLSLILNIAVLVGAEPLLSIPQTRLVAICRVVRAFNLVAMRPGLVMSASMDSTVMPQMRFDTTLGAMCIGTSPACRDSLRNSRKSYSVGQTLSSVYVAASYFSSTL